MAKKTNNWVGPVSLLTVGFLFGLSGVAAKYLSNWLDAYQVVEVRFGIAFLLTLAIYLLGKKKLNFKEIDKKALVFFAVSFPISVIFFTLSIFYTSVALAVFSFYIATLVSSFIVGKLYFDEKIDRNKQLALFFILVAVILFTKPFESFNLDIGFAFGLISGVIQTIASSFQKIVSKSTDRLGLVLIQTLTGFIMAGLIVFFMGNNLVPSLGLLPLGVVVLFGLAFLAIAYLFIVGFKYTNLNVGSILVSSELLFGPTFAFLLLSETLSQIEILGGLSTVVAVYFANKK